MWQHISRIDKQNFDLKLEVFHRRQRNDHLESKVQDLEAAEASYDDLQAKYDSLLLEFDQQKLVLDDAVLHICELQTEKEELQATLGAQYAGLSDGCFSASASGCESRMTFARALEDPPKTSTQASDTHLSHQDTTNSAQTPSTSPGTAHPPQALVASPPLRKGKGSTANLRSLHVSTDDLCESTSLGSKAIRREGVMTVDDEEEDLDGLVLNSPRLSILSESGFSSVYGSPDDNNRATAPPENEPTRSLSPLHGKDRPVQRSAQREARIDHWMQGKSQPSTPPRQKPLRKAPSDRFISIGEVLKEGPAYPHSVEEPPHSPQEQRSPRSVRRGQKGAQSVYPAKSLATRARSHSSSNKSSNIGGKMPPTPDTMSTATVGANSSNQSIVTEKSLLDHSRPPTNGYASLVADGRQMSAEINDFSNHSTRGLGLDKTIRSDFESDGSDDDAQSTQVESGDFHAASHVHNASATLPFMGSQIDPRDAVGFQRNGRPPLTHHATDLEFAGDGYAVVQPSRTISYPSSRGPRHAATQLSPQSQKSFKTAERASVSSTTGSPRSRGLSDMPTMFNGDGRNTSPMKPEGHENPRSAVDRNSADQSHTQIRQAGGRFQLFRRSNSQTANALLDKTSSKRPRPVRSHSSTRAQPRLPNPSNIHGKSPIPISRNRAWADMS